MWGSILWQCIFASQRQRTRYFLCVTVANRCDHRHQLALCRECTMAMINLSVDIRSYADA
jgi:hypothetical protein